MGPSGEGGTRSSNWFEADAWLQSGGVVVAASERARRAITADYHRARQAEGLVAWEAPAIVDWQTFLRTEWEKRQSEKGDNRQLLSSTQEKSIWAELAGIEQRLATLLDGPRNRVAALAMQAHQLLCSFAPQYLRASARGGWQLDAGVFSAWLTAFEETCTSSSVLSTTRLPLELTALLEDERPRNSRPPLLLAGFDRILPVQQRLLDLWGAWRVAAVGEPSRNTRLYRGTDEQTELAACALWCGQKLKADPEARILIISQDLAQRRGEFQRAFSTQAVAGDLNPLIEFSLGIPLSRVALARAAFLLLHWMLNQEEESELDWLFSSGPAVADDHEAAALQSYMLALRRRGIERPSWTLRAFLDQSGSEALPRNWVNRMLEAQRSINEQSRTQKSPLYWAELVPGLLQTMGWPGMRVLSSEEFQVVRRWELALESCASLGFNGRRISWPEFLVALGNVLDETLFAPESRDAPIQIAGPAESAGLYADAIWFMGASEDAWPPTRSAHPLLPIEVQRNAVMPHATSQVDWELSQSIIARILASAAEVRFSYARHGDDTEVRPSRMVVAAAGEPQELPPDLAASLASAPDTVAFDDFSHNEFTGGEVAGGASVLTYQSQCPFKAFATARLGARSWAAAEPFLTAAQRGQLLHAVLHSIWGGTKTSGISTLSEFKALRDRETFVAEHVKRAIESTLKRSVRERLPRRYLEMEEWRLNSLIGTWLEYEAARVEFTVLKTEDERVITIHNLSFDLRLDRIDELRDGTLLVIDYKTGQVTTKAWELPRPEDVQLPLYAAFALHDKETLGGLAFAKVRRGDDMGFSGYLNDARANLYPLLRSTSNLVKNKLDEQMMKAWKSEIERLARNFVAGRAEVDPRSYPDTCERCGLQTLCRIQEHRLTVIDDPAADREESIDE